MAQDLETGLLRAFVTAVRAGSISRAAHVLNQTQPALSQQLRRLERVTGQPLLHRASTGVTPTPAGEALLPYAERILALSALALTSTRATLGGHCGVGMIEDLAAAHLPQALADFSRVHPGATLEVISAPGSVMREMFDLGRVHIALCDPEYLAQPPSWSVRLPLAWTAAPGFDTGADPLPLVMFSQPCRWRVPVLAALDQAGRRWRVAFESTGLVGVQAAVRAGLGVAALMPSNVETGMAVTDALPALPDVTLGLVRRADTVGNPLVDAVEAVLRTLT
nr:LysR family transcriptional regulator [Kibdelosporangium sp. MJ126-NF4]CEL12675.1 Transcriptional regulator, LysR family [Kibdelosporangium sp. MJ126-NF4]CTQ93539.1 Transcriptional regulator, LysR family [Kibdelosporangium sp. MJ126-NF4]